MALTSQQRQAINQCRKSVTFFLRNFGRLKHPSAGILRFDPFSYQRKALKAFRKNRFNIFRKCRQSGASKISGAFATWFAMFHNNKTVLIVSRRDEDAMGFLRDQIVFLFRHLPKWMQDAWTPIKQNEHEIAFPNGSRIQSLTSHPDVLRSNASSLNIIDEAAFIQGMDVLWAGGWSTLQHGGNCIVVSTTNGVGNWYWSTWTDAEAGVSPFNPIVINWWDMDWAIEYTDPLSLTKKRIAPCDDLRECTTRAEVEKYGPFWSPWLEQQYQALQEQGEAWKFQQEILADFIGSGNTVLPKAVLNQIETTVRKPEQIVTGVQPYIHPVNGEVDQLRFDFPEADEGLWIWQKPVPATPEKRQGNIIIQHGRAAHNYVLGADMATGKGRDYSTIEVFDIDTLEQVAEFMARCLPREFAKYIDRLGRYYNCALAVVERNNGGEVIIDSLRYDYQYPRLWRKKGINDKPRPVKSKLKQRPMTVAPYGYATGTASKVSLNKFLLDNLRDQPGEGYTIYSKRLQKQLNTYVRKRDRLGRDTGKTEAEEGAGNYDDLVMACALALVATQDAFSMDASNLMPYGAASDFKVMTGPTLYSDTTAVAAQKSYVDQGGASLLMPMALAPEELPMVSAQRQLEAYAMQLGGIPISQGKPLVTPPKFYFERK